MISTIIPAYNEEKTIRKIIEVVKKSEFVDEIIVVNDGSTDGTLAEIKKTNVEYINLKKNIGKGGALTKGIRKSEGDILLFLDADLIGLTTNHIRDLLLPIIKKQAEMTIGVFEQDFIHKSLYFISGQRAFRRSFLKLVPDFSKVGYGVEIVITQAAQENKIKIKKIPLHGVNHTMKVRKYSLKNGLDSEYQALREIMRSGMKIPKKELIAYFHRQQPKIAKLLKK